MGRKRLIHGFFWDLSLSSVSLPLSTAAYAGPALAGGPARRLPRVDVKCSIYGCYSMTDGLETPRKLCRFAELRPTLMSGDSKKFPGAFVGASQSILAPFNIRFVNTHPDLATYQSRVESLLADEAYRSLLQMAAEAVDPGSCVDELSRAVP